MHEPSAPREGLAAIFRRFLTFGLLAFGGPVAQIGMLRAELVDKEKWVDPARFNRVLAVYQALPGPEAHELCVYFGMLAGGRLGGLLAGLGFMLPGFVFMMLLSMLYVAVGIREPFFAAGFVGVQAAVGALIVTALRRIGGHALTSRPLWAAAGAAFLATAAGAHFLATLALVGLGFAAWCRGSRGVAMGAGMLLALAAAWGLAGGGVQPVAGAVAAAPASPAGLGELFLSGLKAGLLTFGGAYTVIPFLRADAVFSHGWLTDAQFLDGLGLSGVLPAPLIIFSTFVGYMVAALPGALAMTVGIFLPAFAMTLLGHGLFERLVDNPRVHCFLDGVTAGVVGLLAHTTLGLLSKSLASPLTVVVFAAALYALARWKSKFMVPAVVLAAGAMGTLAYLAGL